MNTSNTSEHKISNHHPARVALACQGGGAQTAFTAGVLHYLLYRLGVEENAARTALSRSGGHR